MAGLDLEQIAHPVDRRSIGGKLGQPLPPQRPPLRVAVGARENLEHGSTDPVLQAM